MTLQQATFFVGALALVACGAAPEEFDEEPGQIIGTAEQAVYMPALYGIEGITDWQGHPDFGMQCAGQTPSEVADNWCIVPNSKTLKFSWTPSSCPTTGSFGVNEGFRRVVYDATVYWENEMTLQGWNIVGGGTDFVLKCETVAGTPMGHFQPGPSWDQIAAPYGTLGQYKNGKIGIDSADIMAFANSLAPGSATARYNIAFNLVMHELWHLSGFGHSAAGAGPDIMSEAPDGTWVALKTMGAARLGRLDCYNPENGGLFSAC